MNDSPNSPHIAAFVVGVDFGDASQRALETALTRAIERARSGAPVEVHVVHVVALAVISAMGMVALPTSPADASAPALRAFVDKAWEKCARESASGTPLPIQIVLHDVYGDAASQVVELAGRVSAEAIYIGTHGRTGVARLILGSVAESIVRLSPTTVVVTRVAPAPEAVPTIEPLCVDCATARAASTGATLWCARHAEHHPRPHAYSYSGASYSEMRPWGFSGAG